MSNLLTFKELIFEYVCPYQLDKECENEGNRTQGTRRNETPQDIRSSSMISVQYYFDFIYTTSQWRT